MPLHPGEVLATEDRLTRSLSWVTSFPLPHDSLGVGERGFSQVVTQLHQLTRPISPACDRYVQYFLMGTNPSVLNRHRRELPHRNHKIAIAFSPPFPFECSTGPSKWPRSVSILSNNSLPKWTQEETNPKSHEWEPPLDFYRNLISKHSMS
jgi:hypothetical protein